MVSLKMPDVNSVVIAGNLTHDPTFRKTNSGAPVANFCIASNRKFKDHGGQWRESVCFVGVVAWHKLAESCSACLTKGSAVLVEGELQSRSWKSQDGTVNQVVEIKARRIQFLDRQPRKDGQQDADDEAAGAPGPGEAQDVPSQSDSEFHFGFEPYNF